MEKREEPAGIDRINCWIKLADEVLKPERGDARARSDKCA
jgi:hypothetical protein